jgi:hypothetical protein
MTGGLHGAAVAAAKSYAPQLVKAAAITLITVILLPVIIISALPSVLFGWAAVPAQDLKDRKTYAKTMEACYSKVANYRMEVVDEILAENGGEDAALNDDETSADIYWLIAIDGVKHSQDVYNINEAEIKKLIKESLDVSVTTVEDVATVNIKACRPEELMDRMKYNDEQKNWVKLLYNTTTSSQEIPQTDEDYISGINADYSGVSFGSGSTEVVYYNQLDSRWANTLYGRSGTIGEAGCGPTSLAIAVSTLKGHNVTPVEVANWSVTNGHRCIGAGSYHSLIPKGGEHYGLKVESLGRGDAGQLSGALSSGKLIIVIMNPGHFTKGGHFIVLRGITPEGKILVADPASYSRSQQEWDISVILREARPDAASGGPFWVLSLS